MTNKKQKILEEIEEQKIREFLVNKYWDEAHNKVTKNMLNKYGYIGCILRGKEQSRLFHEELKRMIKKELMEKSK